MPRTINNSSNVKPLAHSRCVCWVNPDRIEPLVIGDLLETEDGQLRICKYVGFEPAQWVVPEPRPQPEPEAAATT